MAAVSTIAAIGLGAAALGHQIESSNQQGRLAGQQRNREKKAIKRADQKRQTRLARNQAEKIANARRIRQGGGGVADRSGTILTNPSLAGGAPANSLGSTGGKTILGA
jgi:hypothetical protein